MSAAPFRRVLVANRGEIALRIVRGLRELGIEAVAVHSEADAEAPHVREADVAVPIGPADPSRSYLDGARLVEAAKTTGADAVHPGYGFLAENADFAAQVEDAGLVFIGPTPEAMRALGSKRRSKEIAAEAGVPTVPAARAGDDPARAAAEVGFPLLIKASAGGGGRGMRLVESARELTEALAAGRREAAQAFGDDEMLLERLVHPARHVEVQFVGDGRGGVALYPERECSIQRRHQKLIEESPSPAVGERLRRRLQEAAAALARAVRYRGAGTCEFLLDADENFYFLEVNARLQVEHPVTECVTAVDLVRAQVLVAAGEPLAGAAPEVPEPTGWALEVRLCAEDPNRGFLPAAGRMLRVVPAEGPGIRIDSGVVEGSFVPPDYDSLLAKIIAHAGDRAAARARLERALIESVWLGPPTNQDFLLAVLRHPAFAAGDLRTDFLEVHPEVFDEAAPPSAPPREVLAAAALAPFFAAQTERSGLVRRISSPWDETDGFRIGGTAEGGP